MNPRASSLASAIVLTLALASFAAPASAQTTIPWSTIDCGGATSTGGVYSLNGTIGQYEPGPALVGGVYGLTGGYWAGSGAAPPCPADFNQSGTLEVADIFAFLNAWFAGSPIANFDGVNGLQVADIFAFLNAWFSGC